MLQTVSPSTKLHIQRPAFVRPLLLIATSSSLQFCAPDDGRKTRLKHVQCLTEINKIEKRCILLVVL